MGFDLRAATKRATETDSLSGLVVLVACHHASARKFSVGLDRISGAYLRNLHHRVRVKIHGSCRKEIGRPQERKPGESQEDSKPLKPGESQERRTQEGSRKPGEQQEGCRRCLQEANILLKEAANCWKALGRNLA